MKRKKRSYFGWLKDIQRFYRRRLFRGESRLLDRFIFRFFETLDVVGKKLSPKGLKRWAYQRFMNYLTKPLPYEPAIPLLGSRKEEEHWIAYRKKRFLEVAQPCDVILVRGNQRLGRIIQTLTHSPYSHSAFYRGDGKLVEADPKGVLVVPIDKYIHLDIRICRPILLNAKGKQIVTKHVDAMIRRQPSYDVANIEKLMFKYLYAKFRPDLQMYIGGSTQFERYYICSGLIAHGFHKAGYPITPLLRFRQNARHEEVNLESVDDYFEWVTHAKKNYSQIVPADFDQSSFFAGVKFLCIEGQPRTKKREIQQEF